MWHTLSCDEVAKKISTSLKNGISEEEVKKRQEKSGLNKLSEKSKENIFIRFFKQFNDFMIIILILASVISAIVSFAQGDNDYLDSIIIIAIVVFNSIMGLIQESKAEKSIENLKKLTPQETKVIRDGVSKKILAENLVVGDIIELESGSFVPADCRIIESFNLKIEESSLTGETEPVLKNSKKINKIDLSLGDMRNMAFMGSIVAQGHGKAIVVEIGMKTKIGKIANMIQEEYSPETPIQRKLGEVGKVLGIVCLVICAFIFIIGIFKKIEPVEMFMTSVGLAVAAIPEGLPAIVTIMLSIGVTKMAKKNAIIRKLPAVETLGSSSVICSDKTGTLTQNKMTVVKTFGDNENFLLELGSMCTDCNINKDGIFINVVGEPTEVAIVNKALDKKINKNALYSKMERVSEIPFDSDRKMMSTIHKVGNKYRTITKGATDILIKRCDRIYLNGKINYLSQSQKDEIIKQNEKMAEGALRVLAVAYKDDLKLHEQIEKQENNLIFVGLIGMIDPPREGVKEAVKICRNAGIKTVMITGDHIATAKAIAKEIGIMGIGDKAITGKELDQISDKVLENSIASYSVFARVNPEHKVRIVKAWQRKNVIVAMTGDGVNDSPALKIANIGIAMGKGGTDVAKSASDMILADDNFVTIVEAVKQGRNIFDNIKKAIHFLLATNIGEIVTIFFGLILGLKSPLLAIQLLWVNLVTDSFPAIALGLEKAEEGIMRRKPRDSRESVFSGGLWYKIILEGIMIGSFTLFSFALGNNLYGVKVGRTMAFIVLGLSELVHSFNIKSEESIFKTGLLENKYLIISFLAGFFLQSIVVMVPMFAKIFGLVLLDCKQWICTLLISILPIIVVEIQKKFNEIKYNKNIFNESANLKFK